MPRKLDTIGDAVNPPIVKKPLTVGSLFDGIGGFPLGFERAGMRTKWSVELDPFCRSVTARRFPHTTQFEDVRHVHAAQTCPIYGGCGEDLEPVDVVCGGFPCQDISFNGYGAGIEGARSGLWGEYARVVSELRPRYVVVENVAALYRRGLGRVLGDLAACGYDAEWNCIPASAVGAPHRRARIWLVAYPERERVERFFAGPLPWVEAFSWVEGVGRVEDLRGRSDLPEPLVSRKDDGLSRRMDTPGNALVPQIAEWIGQRIIEWEKDSSVSLDSR